MGMPSTRAHYTMDRIAGKRAGTWLNQKVFGLQQNEIPYRNTFGVMLRTPLPYIATLLFPFMVIEARSQSASADTHSFWAQRDTVLQDGPNSTKVRIAIWDSGVDTASVPRSTGTRRKRSSHPAWLRSVQGSARYAHGLVARQHRYAYVLIWTVR
jgi:hypothetical protein